MSIKPVLSPAQTKLAALPTEIILHIGEMVTSQNDLSHIARSCKRFHAILNLKIYQRDVKCGRYRALFRASRAGDIRVAQICLDAGADVNFLIPHFRSGTTAVAIAVNRRCEGQGGPMRQHMPILRKHEKYDNYIHFLLLHGADLNIVDPHRPHSALLTVSEREGALSVLRMLLENGADPNIKVMNSHGGALHRVIQGLRVADYDQPTELLDMLRLLLEYGADPNIRNDADRETPLHLATNLRFADKGGFAVVERARLLLEYGADINAQTRFGEVPLPNMFRVSPHLEYEPINSELLKLFLENGADTSLCHLPRSHRLREEILEICDGVSRSTGRQFEFLPGHHQLY